MRHYAKYLNIPIQSCPICKDEVTIEAFRSGLKTFNADSGELHFCQLELLPPMNDREYFEQKYSAQPGKRTVKNGTRLVG